MAHPAATSRSTRTTTRSGPAIILGTHNGTIYNANYLFRRFKLQRFAEVDSELPIPAMSLMVFRHRDLMDCSMEPFESVAQARRSKKTVSVEVIDDWESTVHRTR